MASTVDGQSCAPNEFDLPLNLTLPSPPQMSAEHLGTPGYYPPGSKLPEVQSGKEKPDETDRNNSTSREAGETLKSQSPSVQPGAAKSRRVRTGCLTCRERHLKCDEAVPYCQNCVKSERACRRGVRLNFIDTQVGAPPYSFRHTGGSNISFCDESRDVASEYVGGFERYPSVDEETPGSRTSSSSNFYTPDRGRDILQTDAHSVPPYRGQPQVDTSGQIFQSSSQSVTPGSTLSNHPVQHSSSAPSKRTLSTPGSGRPYLNTAEEVLLMQVFVEEVGLWMDSMDSMKHFSHILPFHALTEPMLLHAFLACGARHLFLVNPSFGEEKALYYYNMSTQDLLSCLQNPNRDTVVCATTAVVLNVYEIMCERAMQRMNHIAGARALIKECRWDAKSTGIGGACFWLNVGMELLSCLHFNWKMAWEPDTWNVDMNMAAAMGAVTGDEELWTHRMVYICAKIADFRSTVEQFQNLDSMSQGSRLVQRCEEWDNLKAWCDEWARCVPQSMRPLGYLQSWQKASKSSFPEVWLIKRSAIVGRLFYHTACCLLSRLHPVQSGFSEELLRMQQTHAHDICGIVAHVKDRGVASVSLRCLAIAAECLVDRTSQEEVIDILDRTIKETGWQVAFIQRELIAKWGWNNTMPHVSPEEQQRPPLPVATAPSTDLYSSLLNSSLPSSQAPPPSISQGIVNPLMASADFSFEEHPYQTHYVAPQNPHLGTYHYSSYSG